MSDECGVVSAGTKECWLPKGHVGSHESRAGYKFSRLDPHLARSEGWVPPVERGGSEDLAALMSAWHVDLPISLVANGPEWDEMKAYMLVQGLVEGVSDDVLGPEALMTTTAKGRRLWALLEIARRLETGK